MIHTHTPATDDSVAWLEDYAPEGDLHIEHTPRCSRTCAGDACLGGCPVVDGDPTPDEIAAGIQRLLELAIEDHDIDIAGELGLYGTASYVDAGVMTRDAGLVLRTRSGAEFQITIVRAN